MGVGSSKIASFASFAHSSGSESLVSGDISLRDYSLGFPEEEATNAWENCIHSSHTFTRAVQCSLRSIK